jgi:hypothetical protein
VPLCDPRPALQFLLDQFFSYLWASVQINLQKRSSDLVENSDFSSVVEVFGNLPAASDL